MAGDIVVVVTTAGPVITFVIFGLGWWWLSKIERFNVILVPVYIDPEAEILKNKPKIYDVCIGEGEEKQEQADRLYSLGESLPLSTMITGPSRSEDVNMAGGLPHPGLYPMATDLEAQNLMAPPPSSLVTQLPLLRWRRGQPPSTWMNGSKQPETNQLRVSMMIAMPSSTSPTYGKPVERLGADSRADMPCSLPEVVLGHMDTPWPWSPAMLNHASLKSISNPPLEATAPSLS